MNIYISAPISGRTDADNKLVFDYAVTQVHYWGHFAINPYAISRLLPVMSHDSYMAIDFEIIKQCADAIYFFPGWKTSEGCRLEHDMAEALGIRIIEDIAEIAKEGKVK